MPFKQIDFDELSDLILRHDRGEHFHTSVQFDLDGTDAVTLELLERIYPGTREQLLSQIISSGIAANANFIAPVLELAKMEARRKKDMREGGANGEEEG